MLIFGMGYTGSRFARALERDGWQVIGVGRTASADVLSFDDQDAITGHLVSATHILSSVPPGSESGDPVLQLYGDAINAPWIGYLSSTGVYGDTGGAWVDEAAPIGKGRRTARAEADMAWQARGAYIFRLPGIYGPGRSALERVREAKAHRIDLPAQNFSRIHVDDIVSAIRASFDAPPGVYNIADDHPAQQNAVIEYACDLLGVALSPLQSLDDAGLSQMARAFYAENRRVANGKAKRLLGWSPQFYDYKQGLDAIFRHKSEKDD